MHSVTVFPDAVSVRYAREQYALGYVQGRSGDVAAEDAAGFARRYVDQCALAGELVDVEHAYAVWSDNASTSQLALFS